MKYALCSLQLFVTEALTGDIQKVKRCMQCHQQYCVSLQHNTNCIMLFRHQLHWSPFLLHFNFGVHDVYRDKNCFIFSKTRHSNQVNCVIITKGLDISLHFHIHAQYSDRHSAACQRGSLSWQQRPQHDIDCLSQSNGKLRKSVDLYLCIFMMWCWSMGSILYFTL